VKQFYAYCVYFVDEHGTEVPLYVGKGHDDTETGYSRIQHYRSLNRHLISRSLYERIVGLRDKGVAWAVKKLVDADDEVHAYALERQFIAEFGREFLENCSDGGSCGWSLRLESRLKMSETRRGKKLGPISEEHRQRLIEAARRRAVDPVWKARHSAALSGRPLSEETKQRISAALSGKLKSAAYRAAISTGLKGVPHSAEHNANNALARIGKKRGHYKTRVDALDPEERHARRLDTYRKSYQKRSAAILAKLQAERDARRQAEWQVALEARGLPKGTPLPARRTPLGFLTDEQRMARKRARERINHGLRKAKIAGDTEAIVRLEAERIKLDECLVG
jgi:hypothetical protein